MITKIEEMVLEAVKAAMAAEGKDVQSSELVMEALSEEESLKYTWGKPIHQNPGIQVFRANENSANQVD